jgi:lipid-binding SYLF domain-containing protein
MYDNPFASPDDKTFHSETSSIVLDSPHPILDRYHTSAAATIRHNGHGQQHYNSGSRDAIITSPRPTLREEAERQRHLMTHGRQLRSHEQAVFSPSTVYSGASAATPTPTIPRAQQAPVMRSTTSPHPLASAMKSQQYYHPTTTSAAAAETETDGVVSPTADSHSLVRSARKEWQKHGSALTQDLEETRRRDEDRQGTMTVRLMSAENRRDVTNRKYTSYVLRVKLANNQVLQLEHRYSEFVKLNEAFKHHGVQLLEADFPPKHLAGRIGNWQLAKRWAPDQHEELVRYRKVQLDVWLVAVMAKYNIGDLPHSLARSVYEFLTLSNRPPCELENTMAMSSSGSSPSLLTDYSQSGASNTIVSDNSYSKKNMFRWNNPISFTLGSSIRQACQIVDDFCISSSDQSIPLDLLQCAKGLIFLTVIKAGFMVSGRIGTGLLIARLDGDDNNPPSNQTWSAPCALGTIGMGWGMLAGGDITHYLVVLTTQNAVEAMLSGTVQLGTEIGVAMGPVGRMTQVSASASNTEWTLHPAYSYAHSKGLFMGMSIEGAVLSTRNDVNAKFYGRSGLTGADLVLDGHMPPPKAAEPLYAALERALATDIPENGFRPSQLFQEQTTITNSDMSSSDAYQYGFNNDDGIFAQADTNPSSYMPTTENNGGTNAASETLPSGFYRPSTASTR